jgi:uncharacterized protein YggU (UPF0235/DUF167 family)
MIQVTVHVHPGARLDTVRPRDDGSLDVRVRAPALDGRANAAVLRLLAVELALRPRQVRLIRGERGRQKLVELELADAAELSGRLAVVAAGGARRGAHPLPCGVRGRLTTNAKS